MGFIVNDEFKKHDYVMFCFCDISAQQQQHIRIVVPTLHNRYYGGSDKIWCWRVKQVIEKTKFNLFMFLSHSNNSDYPLPRYIKAYCDQMILRFIKILMTIYCITRKNLKKFEILSYANIRLN